MEISQNKNDKSGENSEKEKDSIGKITGFFLFRNLINNYNEAKSLPEEERKNIKKYGVLSLILSIIALCISASCVFYSLSNMSLFGFSYVLMLLVFIIGGVILGLFLSIYAFVFAVMQVRLNRKAIGIFGIVLSIISGITSIVLLVLIFA